MPDYSYIARTLSGSEERGILAAGTEQEALGMLAGRSLFPTQLVPAKTATQAGLAGKRVSSRLLANMYSQLGDLLQSGVPLLRSLDLLRQQTNSPALKEVLADIQTQVGDGSRLADAMRRHPRAFSELAVSMVRAGEEGGFLEDSLSRVATFVEHQEDLKGRVIGALVYPLFLAGMGLIIVTAILIFLVPQFEPIFERFREEGTLPWATTVLLAISDFVKAYGIYVAAAGVGVWFWLRSYLATEAGRWRFDAIRLQAWGLGPIVRSLAISRFCRVLGTLLTNGVPLLASLRIAKDATGNRLLSTAIGNAADNISGGKSLARPLVASGQFPPDVMEMIAVGEEANNLEKVLLGIADKQEKLTQRRVDLFIRLLEPMMLLTMAVVILFIVLAILLPVFQSSSALN
jgi:general secretion pathway protein F